jgi:hypothetical protein
MPLLAHHRSLIDRDILADMRQLLTKVQWIPVLVVLLITAAIVIVAITADGPTTALILVLCAFCLTILEGVRVAESSRARARNAPIDPARRRG